MTPEPGYNIDAWRRRIPLLASCIPMNNCSQGPQTDVTRAAAERYLESWNRTGMDRDAWMEEVRLAKAVFGAACHGYYVNGFTHDLGPIVARAHARRGRDEPLPGRAHRRCASGPGARGTASEGTEGP